MNTTNLSDVELAVLQIIKERYGKGQAISRDQLRLDVGYMLDLPADQKVGDRIIRQAIENLRQTHPIGALIVSDPGYEGYWLAEDIEEIKDFVNRKRTTAAKMFQAARSQINLARDQFEVLDQEPQIRMFA